MEGAVLRNTELDGVNWQGAKLNNAVLEDVDLTVIEGDSIDFTGAEFRNVKFPDKMTKWHLREAILEEADLQGVNMTEAVITGANMRKADLKGAEFKYRFPRASPWSLPLQLLTELI